MCIRDRSLTVPAAGWIGQPVELFFPQQHDLRRIIADPARLPHKAAVTLGGETCELYFSAVHDRDGSYQGPMITWERVTDKVKNERSVKEVDDREKEQNHLLQTKVDRMLKVVSAAA